MLAITPPWPPARGSKSALRADARSCSCSWCCRWAEVASGDVAAKAKVPLDVSFWEACASAWIGVAAVQALTLAAALTMFIMFYSCRLSVTRTQPRSNIHPWRIIEPERTGVALFSSQLFFIGSKNALNFNWRSPAFSCAYLRDQYPAFICAAIHLVVVASLFWSMVIPALATLGRTRVTDAEFLAVFKKWRKRQAKLDAAAEKHLQKLVSLASARESEATELVTDNGGVVTAP
jgi:hypothetical protein